MSFVPFNLSFFSFIISALCLSRTPCYLNDDKCLLEKFKTIHSMITQGIPSLGIKDLDVIYQDKVVGVVPSLNYTLTNAEMLGLKKCEVKRVKMDMDENKFALNLLCSQLIIRGHYDLAGEVLSVQVEENGNFSITSDYVDFTFYARSEKMKGGDDKEYYRIKNFKQIMNSKGTDTLNFINEHNGDQEKANGLLTNAKKYWEQVTQGRQDPAIYEFLKVYISNLNNYLEDVPLDQLFINTV